MLIATGKAARIRRIANNLIDETIWQQLLDIARQCEQPYGFEPSRRGKRWLRKGEVSKIAAFPFRAPDRAEDRESSCAWVARPRLIFEEDCASHATRSPLLLLPLAYSRSAEIW